MTDERRPQYEELVAIVGGAAALRICSDFGGRRKYLARPENIGPDNPFAKAIGLAKARELAAAIGGNFIEPPLGPSASAARQAREIERLIREGHTNNAIAGKVGCTRRTVQAHRARLDDERQADLFGKSNAA